MKEADRHLCGRLQGFHATGPCWFPGPDRKERILWLSVVVFGKRGGWEKGRERKGRNVCLPHLRGEAGTHSAFTPCLEILLFRTFNFDSKVEQKY